MGDEFAGKLALVTGAGAGAGRAVAVGLARRGARVIATDSSEQRARQLAASLRAQGLACEGRRLDVGDAEAVEMLVDELELDRPIDMLANVAGVFEPSATTDDAWRKAIRIETDGVFHVSRSVARRMKLRAHGSIVIVSANHARLPRVQVAAHAASKAAAHMFATCLARELAEHGVRCNVITPGTTLVPLRLRDAHAIADSLRHGVPLRRIVSTTDVAQTVLFLFSERARELGVGDPVAMQTSERPRSEG